MIRKILWNIYMQKKGKAFSKYCTLKRYNKLPQKKKQKIQEKRLKEILLHAYHNVPYYNKILANSGVIIENEIKLDNFLNIPILDKNAIRENFELLISKDIDDREWYYNTSGGSTGEPAKFIQDLEYSSWNMAASEIFMGFCGYHVPKSRIILWGSEKDIGSNKNKTLRRTLGLWMQNVDFLNAYNITPTVMNKYVDTINRKKPYLIHAYAESLYQFALFIDKNKLGIYSPRAIITSAGTLFPYMRELIQDVFGAHVFNMYGSREVGAIACETSEHDGLHVSDYTQYVELIDNNQNTVSYGDKGEVIITSLTNYAMPLIRYRIGDIAEWSNHSNNEEFKPYILKNVEGRISDNFISKDGNITFGSYFRHLIFFMDWIEKYQIVQEDYDEIIFYIKPINNVPAFFNEEFHKIANKIKKVMGESCVVKYTLVDDINNSTSGKYRYTISKVCR